MENWYSKLPGADQNTHGKTTPDSKTPNSV